jgi:PBP1b-binding outer membrane lipoprotein LpoB
MKHLEFISLIACAVFLASCESTETAGRGNQESKRLAAVQQRQQKEAADEAQQNLWSAQQNNLNRDGNPARQY